MWPSNGALRSILSMEEMCCLPRVQNHFALWFYNGVFLEDREKKWSAEGGNTKALRQWRFTSKEEIDEKLILAYIWEAVRTNRRENLEAGILRWLVIPELLAEAFARNEGLEDAFAQLTSYKQRNMQNISAQQSGKDSTHTPEKAIPQF